MAECLRSPFDYDMDSSILDQGIYPQYKCWRPHPEVPLPTSLKNYKPLTNLGRVLHFHDFTEVFNKKSIIPFPVRDDSHSILPTGFEGSWFGVSSSGENSNWYGNVCCQVNFQDLLEKFRPKCYFIEIVQYRTVCAPRLLLTTQEISEDINITKYNPYIYGGPWFRDASGTNYYLDAGRLHKEKFMEHPYELEFLLVLSSKEYRRLYDMCEVRAVNHSDAREPGLHKCKKYRSGLRNDVCPTPWSKRECREKLNCLINTSDEDDLSDELANISSDDSYDDDELMFE